MLVVEYHQTPARRIVTCATMPPIERARGIRTQAGTRCVEVCWLEFIGKFGKAAIVCVPI
jgi:hypothetical protein